MRARACNKKYKIITKGLLTAGARLPLPCCMCADIGGGCPGGALEDLAGGRLVVAAAPLPILGGGCPGGALEDLDTGGAPDGTPLPLPGCMLEVDMDVGGGCPGGGARDDLVTGRPPPILLEGGGGPDGGAPPLE